MGQHNQPKEIKISPLHELLVYCADQCDRCYDVKRCDGDCFKKCAAICREVATSIAMHSILDPRWLDACVYFCSLCSMECAQMHISEQSLTCTLACMNCASVCREQVLAILN